HIVREDRLPHRSPQSRGRNRAADEVAKNLFEGALHLAETGERVAGIVLPELNALETVEVTPVDKELRIEAPRSTLGPLPEPRFEEARVVALIQQMQDRILVKRQILAGRRGSRDQPGSKLFG